MYCGIGKIPKGKERGTPEYCVQSNQVRYYGLKKIDRSLLETAKVKKTSLVKEQTKLNNLIEKGKQMLKEYNNLKLIINDEKSSKSAVNKARKRMEEIVLRKDRFVKDVKKQREIVNDLIEKEKEEEKAAKKAEKAEEKKKQSKNSTSKSGSKSSKSSSGSSKSSSKSSKSSKSSSGSSKSSSKSSKNSKKSSKKSNFRTQFGGKPTGQIW
ncbi:hypothetical protein [Acanthamoeba castellanii mimivirus]|nr:hypothetical protein [Acanthamoeba polyphaga mimivirus]BAV61659.1 hypothetical protein [Acanthamoeba castellanii mimivirus]BAV62647.1 hypothetical protein [Acanthamoeba castellanii mimivirus]